MATTIGINIWQTQSLTYYCNIEYDDPTLAADIAKTYIDGAFDQTSTYDSNVTVKSEEPDPKYEGPAGKSFTQSCLCDTSETCSYGSLWDFWNNWLARPCATVDRGKNVDLLLTNYDGTGLGAGDTAVACVGQSLADSAPRTYQKYRSIYDGGSVFNQLDTVLEEVGHALKSQGSCNYDGDNDGDGSGHDSGAVLYNSSDDYYAITPIGVTGNDCENDCQGYTGLENDHCKRATDVDDDSNYPDAWAMFYSQCTLCSFP